MEYVNSEFRKKLNNLINKFKDIFEGNRTLKDFTCNIYVDKSLQLIAQRLRRFSHQMRCAIKEKLKQDWISKNNRDTRTINMAIKRETYPIPTLDLIIDEMHNSKVFTKLDKYEAYAQ